MNQSLNTTWYVLYNQNIYVLLGWKPYSNWDNDSVSAISAILQGFMNPHTSAHTHIDVLQPPGGSATWKKNISRKEPVLTTTLPWPGQRGRLWTSPAQIPAFGPQGCDAGGARTAPEVPGAATWRYRTTAEDAPRYRGYLWTLTRVQGSGHHTCHARVAPISAKKEVMGWDPGRKSSLAWMNPNKIVP